MNNQAETLRHFKSSVPVQVQVKLRNLAESINLDDVRNRTGEAITEYSLGEIEGNYRSGWIPHQDGGFVVSQLVRSDIDSSYHFTEKHTDYVNEQSDNCMKSFLLDNDLESDTSWDDLTEEQQEQYFSYELEWFQDGAVFGVEMFVNGYTDWKDEEKTVTIRTYINYEDAPYFREKYAEDIKVLILDIDDFMSLQNEDIINQITL